MVAFLVVIAAFFVWWPRLRQHLASREHALRDTVGMEARVLKVGPTGGGYRVQCRLVNHRRQFAEQVVFQVAVMDTNGKVLAVNPLANASRISPGEARELSVLVPATTAGTDVGAKIEVSLVRWRG